MTNSTTSTPKAPPILIEDRFKALEERVRQLEVALLKVAYPDPKPWTPYPPYVPYYPSPIVWC